MQEQSCKIQEKHSTTNPKLPSLLSSQDIWWFHILCTEKYINLICAFISLSCLSFCFPHKHNKSPQILFSVFSEFSKCASPVLAFGVHSNFTFCALLKVIGLWEIKSIYSNQAKNHTALTLEDLQLEIVGCGKIRKWGLLKGFATLSDNPDTRCDFTDRFIFLGDGLWPASFSKAMLKFFLQS